MEQLSTAKRKRLAELAELADPFDARRFFDTPQKETTTMRPYIVAGLAIIVISLAAAYTGSATLEAMGQDDWQQHWYDVERLGEDVFNIMPGVSLSEQGL